jgi:hypothetical protein
LRGGASEAEDMPPYLPFLEAQRLKKKGVPNRLSCHENLTHILV